MKKVFFLLPALFAVVLLNAQSATPANQQQTDISKVIDFKEVDHDFGQIPQGKPVEFDLYMKNLSNDTVRIQNVQVGCGCTTPKWQPGPYAAGETFKITVGFSGNASPGQPFNKNITIFFTNGLSKVIRFHGQTFAAPANPAPANSAVQQLKPVNN